MRTVKLGIASAPPTFGDVIALARDAEAAGFDSVWTGEYFSRNAFTTLAAIASATKKIGIGSSIAYAFVRSPVQLAMAAADVDELSGGRLLLGLGTGTRIQNEQWFGVPFAHPGPKLEETIAIERSLWRHRGGPFKHRGRFYNLSIDNFVRHNQVRERIPIYLGVVSPYMFRLAGRVADGLLCHLTCTRLFLREVALPALQKGLEQAGRSRGDFEIAAAVVTVIDDDRERARMRAAQWVAFYYLAKTFHPLMDFHGWDAEKAALAKAFRSWDPGAMGRAISARMWDQTLVLVGTPDEVRRQADELSTLVDHIVMVAPAPYGGLSFDGYRENYETILKLFGKK